MNSITHFHIEALSNWQSTQEMNNVTDPKTNKSSFLGINKFSSSQLNTNLNKRAGTQLSSISFKKANARNNEGIFQELIQAIRQHAAPDYPRSVPRMQRQKWRKNPSRTSPRTDPECPTRYLIGNLPLDTWYLIQFPKRKKEKGINRVLIFTLHIYRSEQKKSQET